MQTSAIKLGHQAALADGLVLSQLTALLRVRFPVLALATPFSIASQPSLPVLNWDLPGIPGLHTLLSCPPIAVDAPQEDPPTTPLDSTPLLWLLNGYFIWMLL